MATRVWNRYVIDNSMLGATMGGEKVEVDDPKSTKGGNIGYSGTTHKTIDNDLGKVVADEIMKHIPASSKVKR